MDKRYQVFVSSTYSDLKEERGKVMQTIMALDCIPAGMELFPAIDEEQFEFIKKIIDDCDYYILIVGGRYGSISEDGISYTEKEYDYAVSKNIPVLAFLHNDIKNLTFEKSEANPEAREKLQSFRDKVSKGRLVQFWNNADELNGKVAVSLMKTIKIYPAVGWVRANLQSNTESLQEINTLRKEIDNLKQGQTTISQKQSVNIQDIAGLDEKIVINGNVLEETDEEDDVFVKKWNRSFKWSEIFIAIAPTFLEMKSDYTAKEEIGNILFEIAFPNESHYYGEINDRSFNVIKIQLMALGLINISDKGAGVRWKLSEKGVQKMLELSSIKTIKNNNYGRKHRGKGACYAK